MLTCFANEGGGLSSMIFCVRNHNALRLFLILVALFMLSSYAMTQENAKNQIGVSLPVILNRSEATYYFLGNPRYPSGSGVSYGLHTTYTRQIVNKIYGEAGLGVLKQNFGIRRPFYYRDPAGTEMGRSTETYSYVCLQLTAGAYYKTTVGESSYITAGLNYHYLHSFRQKYAVNKKYNIKQVHNKSFGIGNSISVSPGLEKKLNSKIFIAGKLILPVKTAWKDDKTFNWYEYSDDTQQIARTSFSAGFVISCYHDF
jgi:hypothetical protein